MAQSDRDILFANETFVIGVLQAVSGAALVAALPQSRALINLAGRSAFLLFLTSMAVALMVAVLAAYLKHQYKLWDVKAQVSASNNLLEEAGRRSTRANRYLKAMRVSFFVSLIAILLGVGELVAAFQRISLRGPVPFCPLLTA